MKQKTKTKKGREEIRIWVVAIGALIFFMVFMGLCDYYMTKDATQVTPETRRQEKEEELQDMIKDLESDAGTDDKICSLNTVFCDTKELASNESNPETKQLPTVGLKTQENVDLGQLDTLHSTVRETSAYTSTVGQTDSTPCISASGDDICKLYDQGVKVVASNAFPIGTKVMVEGYGEAIVLDRMNSRYQNAVDIYFGYDTQRALEWGRRNVRVYII